MNAWLPYPDTREAPLDPVTKLITGRWQERILALWTALNRTSQQRQRVDVSSQGASIAATDIPLAAIPQRIYRIDVFARIVRAGSVSSSLNVLVHGTDGGVAYSRASGAVTTNTTATILALTFPMRIDQNGPIQYSTVYADGGGATSMLYDLTILVNETPS